MRYSGAPWTPPAGTATLRSAYNPHYRGGRCRRAVPSEVAGVVRAPYLSCSGCAAGKYSMLEGDYLNPDAFALHNATTYDEASRAYLDAGHAPVFWRCLSCPATTTSRAGSHGPRACACAQAYNGSVHVPAARAEWGGSFPELPTSRVHCAMCGPAQNISCAACPPGSDRSAARGVCECVHNRENVSLVPGRHECACPRDTTPASQAPASPCLYCEPGTFAPTAGAFRQGLCSCARDQREEPRCAGRPVVDVLVLHLNVSGVSDIDVAAVVAAHAGVRPSAVYVTDTEQARRRLLSTFAVKTVRVLLWEPDTAVTERTRLLETLRPAFRSTRSPCSKSTSTSKEEVYREMGALALPPLYKQMERLRESGLLLVSGSLDYCRRYRWQCARCGRPRQRMQGTMLCLSRSRGYRYDGA